MQKQYTVGLAQINNSFSGANYFPYSVGILQAYVEKYLLDHIKFKFLLPLYKRISVDEAVAHFSEADIVGFSLYVWNEKFSIEVMRQLKIKRPEIFIICGGPQVPDDSTNFLNKNTFIDVVVNGEGENTFLNLLQQYPSREWQAISGISYINQENQFICHPKGSRLKNLNEIPSPYLSGIFSELMKSNTQDEWLALWETNRGCPFKCSFCDWGSAIASKVVRFDMERLEKEMDWFSNNKIEFIFSCDANFGILPRDVEIAEYAAANKVKYGYPHALSVQNTKNATDRAYQTQKILSDAGLNKGVALSMQSLNQETLKDIKRDNISLYSYEVLQNRFLSDNVITYSDLILGLPGETYDSYSDGVSALIEGGQHNRIQFNNLSVLPNAEMGNLEYQKKYGMQLVESKILNIHGARNSDNDGLQEVQKLVVATAAMPKERWCRARTFSWMTAFLYFDKLLQIPISLLARYGNISYKIIFEYFLDVNEYHYPVLAHIRDHFMSRAKEIQKGGAEYFYSKDWLGIWWPDDEYVLIQLATTDKLSYFYEEASTLLKTILFEREISNLDVLIEDAILINQTSLKLPKKIEDIELELNHNIIELYNGIRQGKEIPVKRAPINYKIDRSKHQWDDWKTWCKEVVWYGNKKGDYLYGSVALDKYYAGHY